MTIKLVNQSKLAKIAGVSRQAINKAIDSGLVPHVLDGKKKKVDLTNPHVISYIENATGQSFNPQNIEIKEKRPKIKLKKREKKEVRQSKKQENNDNIEVDLSNDIPDYIKKLADSEHLTFEMLQNLTKTDFGKMKDWEDIKQKRVKTAHIRGSLVSKKLIRVVFGKIYDIDHNQLVELGNKIIPDLMNLWGVQPESELETKAKKIVKDHIFEILKNIKYEIDKFLKKQGNLDEN